MIRDVNIFYTRSFIKFYPDMRIKKPGILSMPVIVMVTFFGAASAYYVWQPALKKYALEQKSKSQQ